MSGILKKKAEVMNKRVRGNLQYLIRERISSESRKISKRHKKLGTRFRIKSDSINLFLIRDFIMQPNITKGTYFI